MDQAAQETVDVAPFGKLDVHHPGIPNTIANTGTSLAFNI
jgi:hypothetical protein